MTIVARTKLMGKFLPEDYEVNPSVKIPSR